MAESNLLGNFIKNRRKKMGFSNTTSLARRLGCSVGYLSRIERGAADGPSLKFLKELATILDVDVKDLLRLKEQDSLPHQADGTHTGNMSEEETSRPFLHGSLTTIAGTNYAMTPLTGFSTLGAFLGESLDVDRLGLRPHYETLAATLFDITEALLSKSLAAEALDVLALTLAIFERLGNYGGIAFTHFKIGRVHRRAFFDQSLTASERLHHLLEASHAFGRAYPIFSEHKGDLADEYRERLPECTNQWGRTDEEIAQILTHSDVDQTDEFDELTGESVRADYKKTVQAFYSERAKAKREAALAQHDDWIATLKSRDEADSAKQEKNMHMLAEAYHRLGVACRDMAHASENPPDNDRYHQKGFQAFHKALEYRKNLALISGGNSFRTTEYLDRLANTHGQFGLSILLRDNDSKGALRTGDATLKEEAYWQYKISERLYELLELTDDSPSVDETRHYLLSIQSEYGLESDIVSHQEIDAALKTFEFGTKVIPKLNYPLTYALKPEVEKPLR